MRPHFAGLWRHPDFIKLWAGQTISAFGSLIGGTALSFTAILFLHATPFQLGLLAAASLAPGFAAGLVAGVWVDRLRRRPILIAADLGRAVILATIPVAALFGRLAIGQLYAVAFTISILTIFFDVAYQSYLPSLVGREELLEGNSKLSATASVAEVSGFGIAGWLVQIFTGPMAILIDAISFLFSAAAVGAIGKPEPAPALAHERESMRYAIAQGLHEVIDHPVLRTIAGSTFLLEFCGRGIFGTVVVLYMARDLGFAPGILGMIFAVGGISSLAGAVLTPPITRRLGIGPAMIFGLALGVLSSFFIPLAQGATALAAAFLIIQQLSGDGGYTLYEINQVSLRQTLAPERLLGRVNASMHFVSQGATLLGSLAGGLLGNAIGVRSTLVVGACGSLLAVAWLMLSPVRAVRTAGEPAPEIAAPV